MELSNPNYEIYLLHKAIGWAMFELTGIFSAFYYPFNPGAVDFEYVQGRLNTYKIGRDENGIYFMLGWSQSLQSGSSFNNIIYRDPQYIKIHDGLFRCESRVDEWTPERLVLAFANIYLFANSEFMIYIFFKRFIDFDVPLFQPLQMVRGYSPFDPFDLSISDWEYDIAIEALKEAGQAIGPFYEVPERLDVKRNDDETVSLSILNTDPLFKLTTLLSLRRNNFFKVAQAPLRDDFTPFIHLANYLLLTDPKYASYRTFSGRIWAPYALNPNYNHVIFDPTQWLR